MNNEVIDHPMVKSAIERVRIAFRDRDEVRSVFVREGWVPGQDPIIFVSDEPLVGCVEVFNPEDDEDAL